MVVEVVQRSCEVWMELLACRNPLFSVKMNPNLVDNFYDRDLDEEELAGLDSDDLAVFGPEQEPRQGSDSSSEYDSDTPKPSPGRVPSPSPSLPHPSADSSEVARTDTGSSASEDIGSKDSVDSDESTDTYLSSLEDQVMSEPGSPNPSRLGTPQFRPSPPSRASTPACSISAVFGAGAPGASSSKSAASAAEVSTGVAVGGEFFLLLCWQVCRAAINRRSPC